MKVVSLYLCLLFAFSYNIIYRNRDTYLLHMYGISLSSFTLHDSTFLSNLIGWTRVWLKLRPDTEECVAAVNKKHWRLNGDPRAAIAI